MEAENQELNIATPGVLDKYQSAGKIAQAVMQEVIQKCVSGADVSELCVFGNKRINEEVKKVYNSKKVEKGISFPVTISVNEVVAAYCPVKEESRKLVSGDLVKIDLGVHIDCFPVVLAHSVIVDGKTGHAERLKVASAAWVALQAAVRSLQVGKTNTDVTKVIGEVSALYETSAVEGVLSHEIKQYLIDSNKVIIGQDTVENKVDTFKFEANEIFGLDVVISANQSEGKTKESEARITVYKRNIDANYDLKSKNGRALLNDVRERFADFAFSLNDFEDQLVM